jgi:hypothetical protein
MTATVRTNTDGQPRTTLASQLERPASQTLLAAFPP